jgi:hypothetical protein
VLLQGIQRSLLLRIGSGVEIDSAHLCEGREVFQLGVSEPRQGTPHMPVFAALYVSAPPDSALKTMLFQPLQSFAYDIHVR